MEDYLNRITRDPQINHGQPSIRGTRHLVISILEYLAAGDTTADIVKEFSDLSTADILACIAYAVACLKEKTPNPMGTKDLPSE